MPAILTHHLFGIDVYDELEHVIGTGAKAKDAFLLGNQGPDPFLCLKALPSSVDYRQVGSVMHTTSPTKLLVEVHRRMVEAKARQANSFLRAYALGFVCHYLLDSMAHPLVYAQQNAICKTGIRGLPPNRSGRIVHALIETELDEYMLNAKRETTVESFQPHREALRCGEPELWAISGSLSSVTKDTYGLALPALAFAGGVHAYRTGQHMIDARRNYPTLSPDVAQLTGDAYLHIKALTHSAALKEQASFANLDHVPWEHPFVPGAVMDASFDELYAAAFAKALDSLPRFAQAGFDASACAELTGSVNFYGETVTE